MVLPEGFVLPPLPYLVGLGIGFAAVVALLWALSPAVTDVTVLAFAPWMVAGSVLHVLYQQEAFPPVLEPLFSTGAVYLTTAIVAGLVWIVAVFLTAMRRNASVARQLGTIGTGVAVTFAMFSLYLGTQDGSVELFWPVIGAVLAGVVAALAWLVLGLTITDAAAVTGMSGALVVFAHSLDGVSTAIGVDVLGAAERTPASRVVLDLAARLPVADTVGVGWLFVLVKVALALLVVWLFEEYVRESPRQARLLLAFVAAVGLGPGAHNLLLFAVAG
ncbi:DUF63 family protein [Halostella sp. JP-L12]|uniref:DUF63 family protein n=1 Tax=Halostella TaxID=1843185 RepID=UPI000EF7F82D|nr:MULTISPECIES: DUF63 family protein [Halostella]NHN47013.1 DUF63 family protein [Halostella sp. JP-L12]